MQNGNNHILVKGTVFKLKEESNVYKICEFCYICFRIMTTNFPLMSSSMAPKRTRPSYKHWHSMTAPSVPPDRMNLTFLDLLRYYPSIMENCKPSSWYSAKIAIISCFCLKAFTFCIFCLCLVNSILFSKICTWVKYTYIVP